MAATATASQAWAVLKRHARDEIATLRLQDLCNDKDRVSSLVTVHNSASTGNMLLVDLSRQRMTLETLNHLLKLSVTRGVRKYITRLAWGQNNPDMPLQVTVPPINKKRHPRRGDKRAHVPYQHYNYGSSSKDITASNNTHVDPNHQHQHSNNHRANNKKTADRGTDFPAVMPSMHFAYRAPKDQGLHMLTVDGVNALTAIHREWDRLERLSDSIRRGAWRGVNGKMIRHVVVVGRGVAVAALKFVYQALCHDESAIMASKYGLDTSAVDWSNPSQLIRRGLSSANSNSNTSVSSSRKIHFLTSVDPLAAASLVSQLDAGSTMVVSLALHGNEEIGLATKTMKTWLLQQLGAPQVAAAESREGGSGTIKSATSATSAQNRRADSILSKHMLLITGNDQIVSSINKPESVFVIPEHSRCEAFINFSAATLLPLSIVFGWSICEQFLAGGHDLDCHFVETNPRHNLPVLLALGDAWNDACLEVSGRIVTPYTLAMKHFPAFVAALEAQTCTRASNNSDSSNSNNHYHRHRPACSSLVLDGGSESAYDRALFQSTQIQHSELVMVMNTQLQANAARNLGAQGMDEVYRQADALMCSLFSHADEMAFGGNKENSTNTDAQSRLSPKYASTQQQYEYHDGNDAISSTGQQQAQASVGNRPSTLLICQTLDAFACGQLIALSEHRAAVKARIWDIDPFTQEAGFSLKTGRTEQLQEDLQRIYLTQEMGGDSESESEDEGDEAGGLTLSTKTILGHYARVRR